MSPLCILVVSLCLQCGGVCNAIHRAQTVNLQVEFGESVILPCNGSAYLGDEGSVQWEAMGVDVAILQGEDLREGDKFKSRVQLPSEEKLREGDWSVVLLNTILSDSDMYECIWRGRKTISTVWLTVKVPHIESSLVVPAGDKVKMACYLQISRGQSPSELQAWWTRNGSTIVSTQSETLSHTGSDSEDMSRVHVLADTKEEFHLFISPTTMSDNGQYRCLYKTRDSDDPRPGIPESITLTVLNTSPTLIALQSDETTTATAYWVPRVWTEEADGSTEFPYDRIPVLLEDSTQPIQVITESQPMETFVETVSSFPDQDTPETSSESLPWIRIGLIAGVLLVTVVVLCILGALRKI
ncbi:uncharacterized protein [Pempheris klunzingeri]|uniref:uncharacterized protein n=1 Tax=Pempheris klunzingeri TaxID=3127111 RepID=UPI0039801A9B